jgi:hypothetical protein
MKIALKNSSANYFRKFKRLQLTFQVVIGRKRQMLVTHDPEVTAHARWSIHIKDGLSVSGAAGRGAGPAGGAA